MRASPEGLSRDIGVIGIALLALNGMIGAGIFGVPAGAAALAGSWSPLVFVACALALALIMLCFAEMASRFERTGGPILYVQTAFGPYAGFQIGWAFYIARITAFAANLNLLIASLSYLWPAAGSGPLRVTLMALIVALLAWINIVGVKQAMQSLGWLTLLKLLPLLTLLLMGAGWLGPAIGEMVEQAPPSASDFGLAALLVVYAFVGWESALVPAGETRNPSRAIPLALFSALALVTLLYVSIQMISVATLPELASSERALIDVAEVLMGPVGALLLTVGVVISVCGNVAGTMISAPRLTFALARQGHFPAWFGALHQRHATPANSILVCALLVLAFSIFGSFMWLAAMSALVRVLIYMLCIATMPSLRRQSAQLDQPGFILPGGWTIPLLAFVSSAVLLTQISLQSLLATIVVLAMGSAVFLLMRNRSPSRE